LIAPIKKSPEYRKMRPRLAGPAPVDSWEDEGLHYFVFQMKPEDGAAEGAEPPVAMFTMRRDEADPAGVLVITLGPGGDHAVVTDLRHPDQTQHVPLG
jgi:hypothetical protein